MIVSRSDSSDSPKSRSNLIVKDVAGELLVYDETSTKAFCLNESAAAIWNMCDGKTSIFEMTQRVAASFEGMVDEEFVTFALARFRDDGLLEDDSSGARPVADVTRAELLSRVGRVGLAAAMAVPLVTSIVAPTAAKAYGLESHNDDNDDNRGDKKSDKKPDDWILRFLRIED